MPPAGFEPTISAGERPQTLDRAATGIWLYCHPITLKATAFYGNATMNETVSRRLKFRRLLLSQTLSRRYVAGVADRCVANERRACTSVCNWPYRLLQENEANLWPTDNDVDRTMKQLKNESCYYCMQCALVRGHITKSLNIQQVHCGYLNFSIQEMWTVCDGEVGICSLVGFRLGDNIKYIVKNLEGVVRGGWAEFSWVRIRALRGLLWLW